MLRIIRKGTIATTLLGLGLSPIAGAEPSGTPYTSNAPTTITTENSPKRAEQIVIVREPGRPERKCVVISFEKQADGLNIYQVRALDDGELMTIHDSASVMPSRVPVKEEAPTSVPMKTELPPATETRADEKALPPQILNFPVPPIVTPSEAVAKPEKILPPEMKNRVDDSSEPPLEGEVPAENLIPKPPEPEIIRQTPRVLESVKPTKPTEAPASNSSGFLMRMFVQALVQSAVPNAETNSAPVGKAIVIVDEPARDIVMPPAYVKPLPRMEAPEVTSLYSPPPANYSSAAIERLKVQEYLDTLRHHLRPSYRMNAAEEITKGPFSRAANVHDALMLAAQEDPAPIVRATCIRCLSKLGVRDQRFMTLLKESEEDDNIEVQEEVKYAKIKARR